MTWVCLECGNNKTFTGTVTDNESRNTEYEATFDSEGDVNEYGNELNSDIFDSNLEETSVDGCDLCGSGNIRDLDEKELETLKKHHFDSSGEFHKEKINIKIDKNGNMVG